MFGPAASVTLSVRLLSLVTTWFTAIFDSVTAPSASCAVSIPPAATPSGEAAVPSPVSVELCTTEDRTFGAAMVSVLPAGVIVMLLPASSETLSNSPLKLRATNTSAGGAGVEAIGGFSNIGSGGFGVDAKGGDSSSGGGGSGVGAVGGVSNSFLGGSGVEARGGDSNIGIGGFGVQAIGGHSNNSFGGSGVQAIGGVSGSGDGGIGIIASGGDATGAGHSGGIGIKATGGIGLNGAADGLAGRFNGNVQIASFASSSGNLSVAGTLSKGGGSFKIDHPLDPENKYLYHSFVESPDMMNIYNGNVTTDEKGEAAVTLPDYFEALNRDFRYQLTVIGTFAQAIVADEIKGNRFVIRTSAPGVKVSWQVTGIRQDAFANRNRIPVEESKPAVERGHYLHPEAFNQQEEKSVDWARHPERMQQLKQRRIEAEQGRKPLNR